MIWSASTGCVYLWRVQTSISQWSWAFYRPTVWNRLLSAVCDNNLSLNAFAWQLKAYLSEQW